MRRSWWSCRWGAPARQHIAAPQGCQRGQHRGRTCAPPRARAPMAACGCTRPSSPALQGPGHMLLQEFMPRVHVTAAVFEAVLAAINRGAGSVTLQASLQVSSSFGVDLHLRPHDPLSGEQQLPALHALCRRRALAWAAYLADAVACPPSAAGAAASAGGDEAVAINCVIAAGAPVSRQPAASPIRTDAEVHRCSEPAPCRGRRSSWSCPLPSGMAAVRSCVQEAAPLRSAVQSRLDQRAPACIAQVRLWRLVLWQPRVARCMPCRLLQRGMPCTSTHWCRCQALAAAPNADPPAYACPDAAGHHRLHGHWQRG